MNKKVSYCLFTYNQEKYIESAILELISHNEDYRNYVLVIGVEDFYNLTNINIHSISLPLNEYRNNKNGYITRYENMSVHVVRNMSGFALIPKVVVESK